MSKHAGAPGPTDRRPRRLTRPGVSGGKGSLLGRQVNGDWDVRAAAEWVCFAVGNATGFIVHDKPFGIVCFVVMLN